jgi:hypothetical protein
MEGRKQQEDLHVQINERALKEKGLRVGNGLNCLMIVSEDGIL